MGLLVMGNSGFWGTRGSARAMKRLAATLILSASSMVCGHFAEADTFVLKDGRKISGIVVEERKDYYSVEISIGTIKIKKEDVAEMKRMPPEEDYLKFGNQCMATQNYDAALKHYRKALEIKPGLQPAQNAIAQIEEIKRQVGQKKQAEAEKRSRELLDKKKRAINSLGFELEMTAGAALVVNVANDSDADVVGMKKGDKIVDIDGRPTAGKSLDDVIEYIVGGDKRLHSFTFRREVSLARKQIVHQKRSFVGVGIFLDAIDGGLIVNSVIGGESADLAGLKPKDRIVYIEDKPAEGMSLDEAASLIGGAENTNLKLVVERRVELERKRE